MSGRVTEKAVDPEKQARKEFLNMLAEQWKENVSDPRWEEFVNLLEGNLARQQACMQRGGVLDGQSMSNGRMEAILDALMPIGTPERFEFELRWQQTIAESIDKMEAGLRERDIVQDTPAATGLIIPGR